MQNIWPRQTAESADNLIKALERDGWEPDPCNGAFHPYVHPVSRRRVIIHYHPRKTYGAKLLQALLGDIGWTEDDLIRLGVISGRPAGAGDPKPKEGPQSGDESSEGQVYVRDADELGPYAYEALCKHCGTRYVDDGNGIFATRRCPKCQGGQPGIQAGAMLPPS